MSDSAGDAQVYSWNWFALHAGQRMQLVNFWLVAIAFLGAAFVQARAGNLRPIAVGVCVAGVVACTGFAMLDARTRRLVQVAEFALRRLEETRAAAGDNTFPTLVREAHAARTTRISSYRFIIEGMQLTVAVLFLVAGVLTALGR